jgi:glutathione S-transferase
MILYSLHGCPECRSVRERLDELKLAYACVNVDPVKEKRDLVYAASGQYGVPVFVDCNKVFISVESILLYLAETYGGGKSGQDKS